MAINQLSKTSFENFWVPWLNHGEHRKKWLSTKAQIHTHMHTALPLTATLDNNGCNNSRFTTIFPWQPRSAATRKRRSNSGFFIGPWIVAGNPMLLSLTSWLAADTQTTAKNPMSHSKILHGYPSCCNPANLPGFGTGQQYACLYTTECGS